MSELPPLVLIIASEVEINDVDTLILRTTYIQTLIQVGLLPFIVSSDYGIDAIVQVYKSCSGVLLSGGLDIDPSLYNDLPLSTTEIPDKNRDASEALIAKLCLEDKKPLIGICRGAQMLAVVTGAKLIQDISIDAIQHTPQIKGYKGVFHNSHPVELSENSKLVSLFGTRILTVPSAHHQSIDEHTLPATLIASGHSQDGIVEVIENLGEDAFQFGFQGHIEADRSSQFNPFFHAFYLAIKKYQEKEALLKLN